MDIKKNEFYLSPMKFHNCHYASGQLPGAIPEEDLEYGGGTGGGGPVVIKQELASEAGSAVSRTSVFSDYLPCGLTRFHFSLCFGLVGFVIFWLGLLLRIYLPH